MKYRVLSLALLFLGMVAMSAAQMPQFSSQPTDHRADALGTSITGTVVMVDGHPVKDARIEVRKLSTGEVVAAGYTLPGGTFSFNNIPAGHYELRAVVGLQEALQRIDIDGVMRDVTLRLSSPVADSSNSGTISTTELRIPDKAKHEYEKAEDAFTKHKMEEARKHCAKALEVAPTYSRALSLTALFDMMDNHLDAAAQHAEASVKSDSGYGMGYIILGAVYNSVQRYADAIRVLDRAMSLVPTSWQAHFEMARAQLGKGDYKQALSNADRAIETAPDRYAPAHLVRAHALLGLKAYSEAVTELEKAIGDDPDGANSAQARETLSQVKAFMATAKK